MTSDSPFGELAGIRPAREIVAHTASQLEQLTGIGDGVIGRYSEKVVVDDIVRHHKIYTAMEAELAEALPDYDAAGLQELVTAYSNKDDSKQEAIVRGMYTGALASVLTQRNNKKGVRTHIHLNGDGNTFPYLLYFAHTLDEVTIEHFEGDCIAEDAADHGGTAKSITLANITGDRAGLYIAGDNGRVGTVTLANITGDWSGASIAWNKGCVGTVTLANITGNWAGAYIAHDNGRVDLLLAVKNKGKDHLSDNHATRTFTTLNGLAKADKIQALIEQLSEPNRAPEDYAAASKHLGELLRAQP